MQIHSKEVRFDVDSPGAPKKLPTIAEMQAKAAEASRNAWKNSGDAIPTAARTDVRNDQAWSAPSEARIDVANIPKVADLRDAYLARAKAAFYEPCDYAAFARGQVAR